jgi:exosortase
MSAISLRNLWKSFAVVAALSFVYATVLTKLGIDWWTDENYSHGLLVPFIILYILWLERDRFARSLRNPKFVWGSALILFAIFALWIGTAGAELYFQRVSLVVMLAGIVVYMWGFALLRLVLVPLTLLLLAIPIPSIALNKLAFPLQLFASRCAVWLMRVFDIPVLRQGNVIELMPRGASVSKKMEVVEACSGIRSLMTLVTLAVVFAYFTHPRNDNKSGGGSGFARSMNNYSFWRSVIIVLAAIPIAIATNALRVGGTGVLAHYFGSRIADGFFHSLSGWVVYILAFVLLFSLAWAMDHVYRLVVRRRDKTRSVSAETDKGVVKADGGTGLKDKAAPATDPMPLEGVD